MNEFLPEGKRLFSDRNRKALSSAEELRAAMAERSILEARAVICDSNHDLFVDLGVMRGVIPREEGAVGIREGKVRDIAVISRVGKPVCFEVTGFMEDRFGETLAVLSRARAQRRCLERCIQGLRPGDVIPARVTHLEAFGAFCDIGCGVVALMPIDAISVSRIEHPDERFSPGMDIMAVIKAKENGRITLSHKELLGTWEENVSAFSVGETVTGIVRSVENYGAFVELTPNLAGLSEPKEGISQGDTAAVYIKSIIPQKMKLKLIVVDSFRAEKSLSEPKYYIRQGHIDRFVYSPDGCEKRIATEF